MTPKKSGSNLKRFWIPLFIFVVAVIFFYKVVDRLPDVFAGILDFIGIISPFLGGLAIAFILYKPAFALESMLLKTKKVFFKRHARGISVITCYVSLAVILAVVLYLLIPRLFTSAMTLIENLPTYYNSAVDYIKGLAGDDGKIFGFALSDITSNLTVSKILSFFDFSSVGKYLGGLIGATGTVIDVLLAFVVSVYVLLGRNHLAVVTGKLARMVLPKEKVRKIHCYMVRISAIFYNYIYSQLIDAVIVCVLCLIVFSVIGVPYALLLAILLGLCNVIPYFGAIIGGVAVVLVTLISTGNFITAIIALAAILVIQQIDANIIQPRIVAESVGLKPLYVLLAIMIGSGLFGFVGILVSVPVMAVIKMIIVDYIENLDGKDTPLVKKQKELAKENNE